MCDSARRIECSRSAGISDHVAPEILITISRNTHIEMSHAVVRFAEQDQQRHCPWAFDLKVKIMKRTAILASVAALLCCSSIHAGTVPVPSSDALSQMFIWWNQAFKTPGGYTIDAFRKHFTEDATLILEQRETIHGVQQWAQRFQSIQAGGGEAEIVVPFKEVFRQGNRIYTYHVIRSRVDGKVSCSLAAGHAVMRDGKIASIVLVRSDLDAAKGPLDPACWRS